MNQFLRIVRTSSTGVVQRNGTTFTRFARRTPHRRIVRDRRNVRLRTALRRNIRHSRAINTPPTLNFSGRAIVAKSTTHNRHLAVSINTSKTQQRVILKIKRNASCNSTTTANVGRIVDHNNNPFTVTGRRIQHISTRRAFARRCRQMVTVRDHSVIGHRRRETWSRPIHTIHTRQYSTFRLTNAVIDNKFRSSTMTVLPNLNRGVLNRFKRVRLPRVKGSRLRRPNAPKARISNQQISFMSRPISNFHGAHNRHLTRV